MNDPAKIMWYDIQAKDALDIRLPRDDIQGPYNEEGHPCPWPWDPPQLVGAPLGQYHCPYCGAMCMTGMDHVDYGSPEEQEVLQEASESPTVQRAYSYRLDNDVSRWADEGGAL